MATHKSDCDACVVDEDGDDDDDDGAAWQNVRDTVCRGF